MQTQISSLLQHCFMVKEDIATLTLFPFIHFFLPSAAAWRSKLRSQFAGLPSLQIQCYCAFLLDSQWLRGSSINWPDQAFLLSNQYSPKQPGTPSIDYNSNEDVTFLFFVLRVFCRGLCTESGAGDMHVRMCVKCDFVCEGCSNRLGIYLLFTWTLHGCHAPPVLIWHISCRRPQKLTPGQGLQIETNLLANWHIYKNVDEYALSLKINNYRHTLLQCKCKMRHTHK